jgi:ferritin-like metal-binding protein YciE
MAYPARGGSAHIYSLRKLCVAEIKVKRAFLPFARIREKIFLSHTHFHAQMRFPLGVAPSRGMPGLEGRLFPQAGKQSTGNTLTMKLESLEALYIEELRDIYNAENQLVKALPKMAKAASSPELKKAFEEHLEQTQEHVDRLEEIFKKLDKKPSGKTCHAMKGLVEEGSEIIEHEGEDHVIDAGLIAAAQKVEHYEIASYGTVRTWAEILGEDDAAELLQQTLDEEGETDKRLTELAEEIVNVEAAAGK